MDEAHALLLKLGKARNLEPSFSFLFESRILKKLTLSFLFCLFVESLFSSLTRKVG